MMIYKYMYTNVMIQNETQTKNQLIVIAHN